MKCRRSTSPATVLAVSLLLMFWGGACGIVPRASIPSPQDTGIAQPEAALNVAATPLSSAPAFSAFSFEENRGQEAEPVKYLARGRGYTVFLTPTEMVLALRQAVSAQMRHSHRGKTEQVVRARQAESTVASPPVSLRLQLVGAQVPLQLRAEKPLRGHVNYLRGQDASQWRTTIPTYERVQAAEVYPGIDVVYYGRSQQLEYDFQVHPGADPGQIRMRFTGVEDIKLHASGDVILYVSGGEVRLSKPQIFQDINGKRHFIEGAYQLMQAADATATADISMRLAHYDNSKPLIIDPVLTYSTYLGGENEDFAAGMALDKNGEIIVVGSTVSLHFPVRDAIQPHFHDNSNYDVFVAKLTANAATVLYATYLGGDELDAANAVAFDDTSSAYIVGETGSTNFPIRRALQPMLGGSGYPDAFIVKLAPNGASLEFATYLGGGRHDVARGIALDSRGAAVVVGWTGSPDFPAISARPAPLQGEFDAFVVKLPATGAALTYATFLGGGESDGAEALALDGNDDVLVTGWTTSPNFPVVNALQPTYGGNANLDAFVAKLSSTDATVVYATYLGGSGTEGGQALAIDATGRAVVAGWTDSLDFPVFNALQPSLRGGVDVFIATLTASGKAGAYATYLGGSAEDYAGGVVLTANGEVMIVGETSSYDFPHRSALQAAYGGGWSDAFMAQITADGARLVFASSLGGSDNDLAIGAALDSRGQAIIVGNTDSANFPLPKAQRPFQGALDAFVMMLGDDTRAQLSCDVDGDGNVDRDDLALLIARRGGIAQDREQIWDVDLDGAITVTDARICATRCTQRLCGS